MTDRKYAAILGVYGNPSDRFMSVGYKEARPSVFERLEIAGKQEMVRAVEITTGAGDDLNEQNYRDVFKAARDNGLGICALNPNLWGEQRWWKGTLGSADPQIRRQAIDHVKRVIDLAAEAGAPSVGLWPGQDSYDYISKPTIRSSSTGGSKACRSAPITIPRSTSAWNINPTNRAPTPPSTRAPKPCSCSLPSTGPTSA